MGCDIHICLERKNPTGEWVHVPLPADDLRLENRVYAWFEFLADVRNYGAIPPISEPRGIPEDAAPETREAHERWGVDAHSASWLSLNELVHFDYDRNTEDRRVTRRLPSGVLDGGCTCDPGEGQRMTFRDYLGPDFFTALRQLDELGAQRIVFWFDN